jgi:hypothetical protein
LEGRIGGVVGGFGGEVKFTTKLDFHQLVLICVFGVAISGSAIWLGSRWYGAIDVVQTITVLSSKDDLFVFVNHNTAVLVDTRFDLLAKQVTSVLNFPEHVSDDLLVVEVRDGSVLKHDLKGFGSGGSAFVYKGDIYWSRGRERNDKGPIKWKWNGSRFAALNVTEASLLDYNHITDIDAATKKEGWNQYSLTSGYRDSEVTVPLRDGDVKVYVESEDGRNPRERVLLVQNTNASVPQTLIDIPKGYRAIGKDEYFRLKDQKTVGSQ